MMRTLAVLFTLAVQAWAAEPLAGTWRLDRQEINGAMTNNEPLTLKVAESGGQFAFAFSVPVNGVYFVSMSYTLKLDGTAADVKNSQGEKVGTIQMTRALAGQYKLILKGPQRPDSSGQLTVSEDGKTLVSEADTVKGGHSLHSKQIFFRYADAK